MTERKKTARGEYRRALGATISICLLLMPLCAEGALHSFTKERFTEEPNVLILLDTSGSMNFRMDNDNLTHGDGSRPLKYGKNTYYYFGRDNNPGKNTTGNNDTRNEFNYHPNLRYIRDADLMGIAPKDSDAYFSKRTNAEPQPETGYSEYKHPNDSRMYALKNVMHRILNDEELYKGLKIALATYYQKEFTTPTKPRYAGYSNEYVGNMFRWKPENPPGNNQDRDLQHIYWGFMSTSAYETALLREEFKSTSNSSHLDNLRKWFSGDGGKEDLRAIGGTPLCYSIYQNKTGYKEKGEAGSALQFFRAPGVITDPCQNNFLIALTDGEDSYVTRNQENYVDNLTKTPMYVYGENTRARNIKTYMMGFTTNSNLVSILDRMAAKGGTGRTKAFIASDVKKLLDDFKEIFQEIQSASTGLAPMMAPPRDEEDEDGLYVLEYDPRQGRQWKGVLRKMRGSVDDDGKLTYKKVWEAGERLARTPWDGRKVYASFEGLSGNGTNLFRINSSFANGANPLLDSAAILDIANRNDRVGFVRWLCGKDEYNEEGGGEIHKLWDIMNSGMVKVGPPSAPLFDPQYAAFRENHKDRSKLIYVQSNAGMLHAFDYYKDENIDKEKGGEEAFAFIPPNVLSGGRLSGLRRADGGNEYSDGAFSYSRYLLDGPVTVEDVFTGGQYRTLLLGQLGFGGAGMYVLDVTPGDPDKGIRFKWAIENDVHSYDTVNNDVGLKAEEDRKVLYWKGSGDTTAAVVGRSHNVPEGSTFDAEYDYRRLRRTVGVPYIGRVHSGETAAASSWKWLFIMTSGSTNDVFGDYDSHGAVYIGDLDDGRIIRKFDVASPVTSSVIPLPEERYKEVSRFFVGDVSGNVHTADVSDRNKNGWSMYPLLEFPTGTSGISRSLSATRLKNNRIWVFAGTGDVTGHVANPATNDNYFAAANVTDVQNGYHLKVTQDLAMLNPERGNSEFDASEQPGKKGWYLKLAKQERMASPPVYYGGLVLFTTFIPDEDVCSDNGNTRFYILNSVTGKSAWNSITETTTKYKQYDNKKIPGFGIHSASGSEGGEQGKYAFTVILPDGSLLPIEYESLADDIPFDKTAGELIYWRSR